MQINLLSILVKVSAAGLMAGLVANGVPNLGQQLLPLAELLGLVAAVLAVFELTRLEPAVTVVTETPATPSPTTFDRRRIPGPR